MRAGSGYRTEPISFNRLAVAASLDVSRSHNTIHAITEVDIATPRRLIREHREKSGESLSLTAYIVTCLGHTVAEFPEFNSFRKGRRLVYLEDVTIGVLVEREVDGKRIPEPCVVDAVQSKNYREVNDEIRSAQQNDSNEFGALSGSGFLRWIPAPLLKLFVKIADSSIRMGRKYGKVAVTAVGMFGGGASWFLPISSATTCVTVGSISNKVVLVDGKPQEREHLCLTLSFNHDIIDGSPAARFGKRLAERISSGELIQLVLDEKRSE